MNPLPTSQNTLGRTAAGEEPRWLAVARRVEQQRRAALALESMGALDAGELPVAPESAAVDPDVAMLAAIADLTERVKQLEEIVTPL